MATVARTKQDVDEMTRQERLWDSLNHAYGQQREATNREYDKAIAQADRQMTGRGMQRSSYGAQVRGNLNDQKIRAQDDSWNNQIAKYEEGMMALDQQDAENERWEKQFNEGVRQFNENLSAQREENALSRAFQTAEREAQQAYQSGENAINRAYNKQEREAQQAWQSAENRENRAYNTAEREAQQAYNTAERIAQQDYNSAENATNRSWQAAQTAAQQLWQSGENALTRAENARQFNEQMAYNNTQADRSADQWERSFAQDNMTADQKLAASYVAAIAEQGGIPSDELLARAGLSREDAMAMRKNAKSSGSSGSTGGNPDGSNPPTTNPNDLFNDPTGGTETPGSTTPKRTKEEMVNALQTVDDRLYEKMFGPSATNPISSIADNADEELAAAFAEYMNDPEAYKKAHNLQVVDFSGKSPTGWTDEGPYDSTQTVGVAMNTNDIANSPANRLTSRVRDENVIDPNAKTAEERFGSSKKREKTYWEFGN